MFKSLRSKSYIKIAVFLLISMAIAFFIVYTTYSALLTEDYIKKQQFLTKQTTQTLGEYLMFLDEQTDLLINKNQIPENIRSENYIALNNIHFDNIDFSNIEIYSKDKIIVSNAQAIYPTIGSLSIKKIKNLTKDNKSIWYTTGEQNDQKNGTVLMYIKTITDSQGTAGYLAAWVNPDTINQILSLSTNAYTTRKDKMFTDYISATIEISDTLYICGKKDESLINSNPSDFNSGKIKNKTYMFKTDLGVQNMSLLIKGDASQFKNHMNFVRRVLIAGYIIIALLIIFFLYLFTRKIDSIINSLYEKMMIK